MTCTRNPGTSVARAINTNPCAIRVQSLKIQWNRVRGVRTSATKDNPLHRHRRHHHRPGPARFRLRSPPLRHHATHRSRPHVRLLLADLLAIRRQTLQSSVPGAGMSVVTMSVATLMRCLYGTRINETFRYADWDRDHPDGKAGFVLREGCSRRLVLARRSDS